MTALGGSITVNASTGSDTASSGWSLSHADSSLNGSGASTNNTTTVDLSADNPNLSAVNAGDLLFVNSSAGQRYSVIASADDILKTVTCDTAFTQTESGRGWAIGGKLASIPAGLLADMVISVAGTTVTINCETNVASAAAHAMTQATAGANSKVLINLGGFEWSHNLTTAIVTMNSGAPRLVIKNGVLLQTNATKAYWVTVGGATAADVIADNVRFGNEARTNSPLGFASRASGTASFRAYGCIGIGSSSAGSFINGSASVQIVGCHIARYVGASGITHSGNTALEVIDTIVAHCGTTTSHHGIASTSTASGGITIKNCTIDSNTGDGLNLAVTAVNTAGLEILDNIISNNGGQGIENSLALYTYDGIRGNAFYLNAGTVDLAIVGSDISTSLDASNIRGTNPGFTNNAVGVRDYTPSHASIIGGSYPSGVKVGGTYVESGVGSISYGDIGAIQTQYGEGVAAGGGGGMLIIPIE